MNHNLLVATAGTRAGRVPFSLSFDEPLSLVSDDPDELEPVLTTLRARIWR